MRTFRICTGAWSRLVERAREHVERVALPHELLRQAVVEAPCALVVRRAVLRQVLQETNIDILSGTTGTAIVVLRYAAWPDGYDRDPQEA